MKNKEKKFYLKNKFCNPIQNEIKYELNKNRDLKKLYH